ncbi:DUF4175 family protein [Flagellimonas myxillae]|uniref:DUF4175 family protein n=1 Tax=Flagellimonas myxillae TaxID=2942214 RepID=UPI00201EADD6|nr:DUF4175 family protein [Muricauda myxillae]MCL6266640.1 hypothetical protein [Muricauda myxillae]
MDSFQDIIAKLQAFTKKYYTKQLMRGVLLFLTLGLLFWITVISFEHFLWLNELGRLILFLIFILVEVGLLIKFVAIPLVLLLGLRNGISNKEASKMIARHFPQIGDRLHNLLDLRESSEQSELLLASIEQRSAKLKVIPFKEAINFREVFGYAKYFSVPLIIIGCYWISGNIMSFFGSHDRVVNYDVAFKRPAPFQFLLLNEDLEILDNESLNIMVAIEGETVPENVTMVMDGEELFMKSRDGIFSYTLNAPVKETNFHFNGGKWKSREYQVSVLETPVLTDFLMEFNFPSYLKREAEEVSGTGNAVIPEGTEVTWKILGNNLDEIGLAYRDTLVQIEADKSQFVHQITADGDLEYEISTSNSRVRKHEILSYKLEVVKDAYPRIQMEQSVDSLTPNVSFFEGQVSDDYGVSEVRVVCHPTGNLVAQQKLVLERPGVNVHQLYYTFPSGFDLRPGEEYTLFFEVVDNDGLRGGKKVRSRSFTMNLLDDKELKTKELDINRNALQELDNSLEKYKNQQEELRELKDTDSQSKERSFERENKIKDVLERQRQQESLMEKFSQELKESLEKEDSERSKLLKERLERQEIEARKNKKLLDELNKLSDKIEQEELQKKLEELSKKQSSNTRNLEQILELTKRYYVTEKMKQLASELDKLSERQKILSQMNLGDTLDNKLQKQVGEEFDKLSEDIDELRKENEGLRKPMEFKVKPQDQERVKEDQKEALEEINKHQGIDQSSDSPNSQEAAKMARERQKAAAQKLKEMSESMQQTSSGGGGSDVVEDAEMLRQILDNLVTFSFKQENLFDKVEAADVDISQFSTTVRDQKELRSLFEHVDDSLFALSLRRVELSEFVNEQITEVYYNIDKSLESIAENQIYQGASYQQYVVNATNALADFLANILDNMQESMKPGQGKGQGQDFQLPDIIKGQQGVQEKMSGKGQEGKSGEEGQQGKGDEQGSDGEAEGEKGSEGNTGEEPQKGSNSSEGGKGKEQGSGTNGNGDGEMSLEQIYDIYKEQQAIRQQLEKQLKDMISKADRNLAQKLVRQMEDFENDLLENGITERTRNKANIIQHELLKLENAELQQGRKKEREANTNTNSFSNPITTKPALLKRRKNEVEILNRQALPLRQNYERKVKGYFDND